MIRAGPCSPALRARSGRSRVRRRCRSSPPACASPPGDRWRCRRPPRRSGSAPAAERVQDAGSSHHRDDHLVGDMAAAVCQPHHAVAPAHHPRPFHPRDAGLHPARRRPRPPAPAGRGADRASIAPARAGTRSGLPARSRGWLPTPPPPSTATGWAAPGAARGRLWRRHRRRCRDSRARASNRGCAATRGRAGRSWRSHTSDSRPPGASPPPPRRTAPCCRRRVPAPRRGGG